jgi:hypothetical protein
LLLLLWSRGPAGLVTALAVNRWRLRFCRVQRHLPTGAHLGLPFIRTTTPSTALPGGSVWSAPMPWKLL